MSENSASSNPVENNDLKPLENKKKLLILGFVVTLVILLGAAVLFFPKNKSEDQNKEANSQKEKTASYASFTGKSPDDPILKVGNETIYKKDFDAELASYPPQENSKVDINKIIVDKLINDSTTLQAAQEENLVTLNPTLYNSDSKNYTARIEEIKKIQEAVTAKDPIIEGTVVTVWFYNLVPAPIGLEKGQKLALEKITNVYNQVKDKKITIQQAGTILKNDKSLAEIDISYEVNALIPFKKTKNEPISFEQDINKKIAALKPGQLSEVLLGYDTAPDINERVPAFYAFAQVTKNTLSSPAPADFNVWLSNQKKKYEVTVY